MVQHVSTGLDWQSLHALQRTSLMLCTVVQLQQPQCEQYFCFCSHQTLIHTMTFEGAFKYVLSRQDRDMWDLGDDHWSHQCFDCQPSDQM